MIVIVGAGATGSHAALFLRNREEGLKVVDHDRIESKNVLAQFHSKMGLRKNKAQALAQAFQGLFGTRVQVSPHKLSSDNWRQVLGDASLVLDCTDNIEARELIQMAADELDLPCLHAAMTNDGTFGRVMWRELFVPDEEDAGVPTCEDGANLPFHGILGAWTAQAAQTFLDQGDKYNYQVAAYGGVQRV